ncbi:ROK family protein [Jatrophihabitans sp. YIM 134969]
MSQPPRPAPAGGVDVRGHNASLVLTAIAHSTDDPRSRAQIAALTGLTRATVSTLVDELAAAGLVEELGAAASTGRPGRPGSPLRIAPHAPVGVGVEIDADVLAATAVTLDGRTVASRRTPQDLHAEPPDEVVARVRDLVADLVPDVPVAGVGVAVAGLVDGNGVVRTAPNLQHWDGADLRAALAAATGLPVTVDNDANLAALAHRHALHRTDFVFVSGEIGVGAGLVLGGQVFRGGHGFAGEFGHVVADPTGPPCGCGGSGCVEQYAGEGALAAAVGLASPYDPEHRAELVTALTGTADGASAIARAGRALGVGLASLINLVDVDDVVIGGLFAEIAPQLSPVLVAELARRVPGREPRISVSSLGADAAMHGAAVTMVQQVLREPLDLVRG